MFVLIFKTVVCYDNFRNAELQKTTILTRFFAIQKNSINDKIKVINNN